MKKKKTDMKNMDYNEYILSGYSFNGVLFFCCCCFISLEGALKLLYHANGCNISVLFCPFFFIVDILQVFI